MSLGHMTRVEQAITIGGVFAVGLVGLVLHEAFGPAVGVAGGGAVFVAMWVAKFWAWKHTSYENGFSDPSFDR